jgi:hypothetical protein
MNWTPELVKLVGWIGVGIIMLMVLACYIIMAVNAWREGRKYKRKR